MPTELLDANHVAALAHKHVLIEQFVSQLEGKGAAGDSAASARASHARAEVLRIKGRLAGQRETHGDSRPDPHVRNEFGRIGIKQALEEIERLSGSERGRSVHVARDELLSIGQNGSHAGGLTRSEQEKRTTSVRVKEQATYQKGDPRRSYMQDLIRVQLNMDTTGEARDRLMRHASDIATLPEYTEYRDLSRTDGSGGYAIPPAWLMDMYVALARPGRAFANLVQNMALPSGTDSINIPKLLTGTATGIQTADNTVVPDVDLTDTFINTQVRTIAGQQSLSVQLLDQSPIAFDEVVFRDLAADYAMQVDRGVLEGSGIDGQILGVHNTEGIQSLTVNSPTIQAVYSAIANAIQLVHTLRFQPPEVIVMSPIRWAWFLSLLDPEQRPLFLPSANRPMNSAGVLEAVASQQIVGQLQGLPVVTDPNIFASLGPSNSWDAIYVLRASDILLWESGVRTRVLPQTKAQNLSVLIQIFGFLAFTAGRYAQSIVEITGPGLAPPVF